MWEDEVSSFSMVAAAVNYIFAASNQGNTTQQQ
jgi:hypothetical protein